MTVCIAAKYKKSESETGIVMVTDWQITDSQTSFKSEGMKLATLTSHIAIMGSGDMTYFGDLVVRVNGKLAGRKNPTVEDAADAYWEAETDWQNEYREHHVLGKYNLNWTSYTERLAAGGFPESFFAEVNRDLKNLQMPCVADAIIAGCNLNHAAKTKSDRIIKIENGIKDSVAREGYGVIGEGNTVALAEFGYSGYKHNWSLEKTLFLCYMAKKRSEVIASVGEMSLVILISSGGIRVFKGNSKTQMDKVYKELERTRSKAEKKAYEKAGKIIEEYETIYGEKPEDTSTKSAAI